MVSQVPCPRCPLLNIPTPDISTPPGHTPQKGPGTRDTPPRKDLRTWDQRYLPPCEQTDTCENITFPQLRLQAVKSICLLIQSRIPYSVMLRPPIVRNDYLPQIPQLILWNMSTSLEGKKQIVSANKNLATKALTKQSLARTNTTCNVSN